MKNPYPKKPELNHRRAASVLDFAENPKANHQPVARILGESVRTVRPGEKIILDASSSFDPDKNSLSYQWWQYREAGSVQTKVAIKHADEKRAEIIVPDNPGKQLHLILELTDNGIPNLKSYKRIILNINPLEEK